MACQGCGRESENRLCCPTCKELGQTSFFCSQECFAKNWAAHTPFHDAIRKKKADEAAAAARAAARPAPAKESASYPRGMGAPLPGGMPLVSSFGASQKRASTGAAKKSDDGVASPPGSMFGSFFDRAKALLSGSDQKPGGRGNETQSGRPGLRERSPAPAGPRGGAGAAALQKPKPAFSLQTGLVAVIVFAVLGGGLLYVQHQRFAEEAAAGGQAALTAAAAAAVSLEGAVREETLVVAEEATGAHSNAAATSPPVSADLKAELQALRETVDKHEKMLRYVMDRYVEKDLRSTPQTQQGGVQASVVNASQSGVPAVAEVKSEARAGDAPRKRKAGGDTSMVGMPQPESTASAEAIAASD